MDATIETLDYINATEAQLVSLQPSDLETACELSQRIPDPGKRWSVYLNALALFGFRQWLQGRSLTFQLQDEHCIITEPAIVDGISAVCKLSTNQFKICIIALEPDENNTVPIPKSVFDRTDLRAHCYIFISVYEEQEAIGLHGYLFHDAISDSPNSEQDFYNIPNDRLSTNFDHLLLHLTCLEPTPILRPVPASLPLRQWLIEPILNTGRWFNEQIGTAIGNIENAVTEFTWQLTQPLTFASALRESSPNDPISIILSDLTNKGVEISTEGRSAIRLINLGELNLQLHAIVSPVPSETESVEDWSLVLVLKCSDDQPLPYGVQLEVYESYSNQLVEQVISSEQSPRPFIDIIATQEEALIIIITLVDGTTIALPPMTFQP